eukprot:Sspe_Gene.39872::Locus_19222_Transcript_2_3_Confidence_0.500_Length_4696::g.39872::m.39872
MARNTSWEKWLSLERRLQDGGCALIDSSVATEVERHAGPESMDPLAWSGLCALTHPDEVKAAHAMSLHAGGDIVVANTYAANRNVMDEAGKGELAGKAAREAVALAKAAREEVGKNDALIAGSVSCHPPAMPVGAELGAGKWPPPSKERENLATHCSILAEAGVDLLVVEMVFDTFHAKMALDAACSVGLPVILSFAIPLPADSRHGKRVASDLLEGAALTVGGTGDIPLSEAVYQLTTDRPSIVAVCIHHTHLRFVGPALQAVRDGGWQGAVGGYPMQGTFHSPHWEFENMDYAVLPAAAAVWAREYGARVFGVGCGLNANHLTGLNCMREVLASFAESYRHSDLHRLIRSGSGLPPIAGGVDHIDSYGFAPLHWAARQGDVAAVQALLDAGADTTVQDAMGRTPACIAAVRGDTALRRLLQKRAQGPRKVFTVRLMSPDEPLGLDLLSTEGGVLITGVGSSGAGARAGVEPGMLKSIDGQPVAGLPDVVAAMGAAKRAKRTAFPVCVQVRVRYDEGTPVEVLRDLVISGRVGVRKGSLGKVVSPLAEKGTRIVVDVPRCDDRSGPIGAHPCEIAPVLSAEVGNADVCGVYCSSWSSCPITVTRRSPGGYHADTKNPGVISVRGTSVTFRAKNEEGMSGEAFPSAILWDNGCVWSRKDAFPQLVSTAPVPMAKPSIDHSFRKNISWAVGKLSRKLDRDSSSQSPSPPLSVSPTESGSPRVAKSSEDFSHPATLHQAVEEGDVDAVQKLLGEEGCDIDCLDSRRRTPLHIAAEHGLAEITEILLERGANTTIRDDQNLTAADVAAARRKLGLRMRLKESEQGPRQSCRIVLNDPAEQLGLDLQNSRTAVRITAVNPNSAGGRAGCKPGTLLAVENTPVKSLRDVVDVVGALKRNNVLSFTFLIQGHAPPRCPSGHTMERLHGAPVGLRAYMPMEGELALCCDICETEEDLQDKRDGYYHCDECEHDVCIPCAALAEYSVAKRVEVLTDLIVAGQVAVPAGAIGKVVGVHATSDDGRRIVIQTRRCDGREGPIGAMAHELVPVSDATPSPPASPAAVPADVPGTPTPLTQLWRVVWSPGVRVRSRPGTDGEHIEWKRTGECVSVIERRACWVRLDPATMRGNHDEYWMLINGKEIGLGKLLEPVDQPLSDPSSPSPSSHPSPLIPTVSDYPGAVSDPGDAQPTVPFPSSAPTPTPPEGIFEDEGPSDQARYRARWHQHLREHSGENLSREIKDAARVWAVSDMHVDHKENMRWLETLPEFDEDGVPYSTGILICAGDVCTKIEMLRKALVLMRDRFQAVFYCVGNHELWQWGKESPDSVEKFFEILTLCAEVGVHTTPAILPSSGASGGPLCIVPLQSWYKSGFIEEEGETLDRMIEIFDGACKWPPSVGDARKERNSLHDGIGDFFLSLNAPILRAAPAWHSKRATVISFSHFIPRPELFSGYRRLGRVMGCTELDDQITVLDSTVHVFGHSHLDVDEVAEGRRYVQHNLGYPRDRSGDKFVKCVWFGSSPMPFRPAGP